MRLISRTGKNEDKRWLFSVYKTTLRHHIEETWGWDEKFQQKSFKKTLHPRNFRIISHDNVDCAAYVLVKRPDYYWLEMLLVSPEKQRQGIGKKIMNRVIEESQSAGLPLGLSIIKTNPVLGFYTSLGFVVFEEDDAVMKLRRAFK